MREELVKKITDLERRLDALKIPETVVKNSDAYLMEDPHGVWQRLINYGQTPNEHWKVAGADDIAWTGWAAYTGFITPDTISIAGSQYLAYDTAATGRMFRYRPYINAQTIIQTLCFGDLNTEIGIMVDDGVNNVDGNGANNFVRAFLEWNGGIIQLTTEYRAGGGAVTKTVRSTPLPPTAMVAMRITYGIGTRWANWSANLYIGVTNIYNTSAAFPFLATITSGLAWTPARHGIYGREGSTYRELVWDWFDE